jgi:hypothetical protein
VEVANSQSGIPGAPRWRCSAAVWHSAGLNPNAAATFRSPLPKSLNAVRKQAFRRPICLCFGGKLPFYPNGPLPVVEVGGKALSQTFFPGPVSKRFCYVGNSSTHRPHPTQTRYAVAK